jgi:hypothetical protein
MTGARILVSSWNDGVIVIDRDRDAIEHELAGRSVRSLTRDREGRALAIVDGAAIYRRSEVGVWSVIAQIADSAACVACGPTIYVGTDDAQVLRVDERGTVEPLTDFQDIAGRERWYAGQAVVDGRLVGPPLGVRSLAASCDARVVFANVHVGGIPLSRDDGRSWQPTIDVELDAHEVCAHPRDPQCVIAATAAGLVISRDAGHSWSVEARGLHALHCAAVAFVGDDLLISCAGDQFAPQGAVYRRPVASDEPLALVGRGLPAWTAGIVDTNHIAALGACAALVDRRDLYVSTDAGASWSKRPGEFSHASSVVVVAAP